MESLYFLFLAGFIVVLIFPLTFDIKLSYDLLENRGGFSIRLWFIWIKVARIKRKGKGVILIEKHKNNEIEVELTEPQLRFLRFFNQEVNNKIKIRKVNVYSKFGVGEPFKSALFSSAISNLILGIFARLRTIQPTASFRLENNTDFYDNSFIVAISARLALSIFDVLYTFVISILRTRQDRILERKINA